MDLGAFGAWWGLSIGSWWDSQQWGSVSSWVSGVLTAGSLTLGFTILAADRKRERERLANRFMTHTTLGTSASTAHPIPVWHLDVIAFNGGDMPIRSAYITQPFKLSGYLLETLRDSSDIEPIAPQETVRGQFNFNEDPSGTGIIIEFSDANGLQWSRDALTGKYISRWRHRKYGWPRPSLFKRITRFLLGTVK